MMHFTFAFTFFTFLEEDFYMGVIIMRAASADLARGTLTWVLLPLNQLSRSFAAGCFAAGCTGLALWRLMASLPQNMAFPPKLVLVRLLLKLPSSSLGSALDAKDKSEVDIANVLGLVWGSKGVMICVKKLFLN
jgi:hypothetical protein